MLVKELIKKLKKLDQNTEIGLNTSNSRQDLDYLIPSVDIIESLYNPATNESFSAWKSYKKSALNEEYPDTLKMDLKKCYILSK